MFSWLAGNGGFRIWKYDNKEDAAAEVRGLVTSRMLRRRVTQSHLISRATLVPHISRAAGLRFFLSLSQAVALAQGMEVKHMVYNTGCAGAKVLA